MLVESYQEHGVVLVLVSVTVAVAVGLKKSYKIKTATLRGFNVAVAGGGRVFDFSAYGLAVIACKRSKYN